MGRARSAFAALVLVLAVLVGTVVAASPAAADGEAQDSSNGSPINTAIVENTTDNSSVFQLAFDIRTITNASTVAPGNAAIAIASCSNCQTVAIAVQIVFVVGSPQVFAPENAAVAVNTDCSFCDTLATAYQFVVQTSVPVQLTKEGKKQLHDIYKALQDLEDSGLTSVEIQAKVDELMQQLAVVLATEVEPIPGEQEGENSGDGSSTSPSSSSSSSSSSSTTTTVTVVSTTSTSTSTSTTTTTTTTAPSSS